MKKHSRYLPLLAPIFTCVLLFCASAPTFAFTSSDAGSAMNAYITTFYDTSAKYFYADTTHSSYNDFWKEAISWDIVMDADQRTRSATYRQMINDVYDGFIAHNSDMATVNDDYNSGTLHTWQFTYNYGTFIGGATALSKQHNAHSGPACTQ